MEKEFSKEWNKSKKPSKQRKYIANAPLHIKSSFLSSHLSKELRVKYGKRSLRVKKDDKVTIMECRPISKKKSFIVVEKIEG